MTRDERRTAHLMFAPELADGTLAPEDLTGPELARAVEVKPVPSAPSRALQRRALRRGDLSWLDDALAPALAARRALLGDRAEGPPRVLLRVDGYGDTGFADIHGALTEAGVPHLVPVPPDPAHRERLVALRRDGAAFAQLGVDGTTDLTSLSREELGRGLDAGRAALREMAIHAPAVAAPGDRFGRRAWPDLARRFDVVCGGPATAGLMGFHPPGQWRGEAVYLPAYPPLHGPAAVVAATAEAMAGQGAAVWAPAAIDARAEREAGMAGVERLAAVLAGGIARPWEELIAAVESSRRAG